jgi:hypothetical protein
MKRWRLVGTSSEVLVEVPAELALEAGAQSTARMTAEPTPQLLL